MLKRSVESDIVTDESDFVISKTAVVTVIYVYNNDGELAKKRVVFADNTEQEFVYITEENVENTESNDKTLGDDQSWSDIFDENFGESEIETSTEIKNEGSDTDDGEMSDDNSQNSPVSATTTTATDEDKEKPEIVTFKMGETEFTARSDYDGFGRKSFDELKLQKGFISRQFSYHAGKVTEVHKEKDKLQSAPVTQLVSQIILSDGRTLNYEYDKEERVTKVIDSIEGTTEYTYDALGQLLTETKNGQNINTMTYDNYGNILSKNGKTYTYGDNVWKDKLTKFDGLDITYDSQGNPINYLGHNLTWEKGRQLKSYDDNTYTYNANGIRTSKTVNNIRHDFTLDGAKILKETWENNTLIPLYDNADEVCGIIYNNTPYFFLKNLQGDVIAITDDNGETVAKYSYDAWGVCTVEQDLNGIANINPYRYRSYYYDSEIGMYYLQSRYYNPNVGRFVNGDRGEALTIINNPLANNAYSYCCNNAVNEVDLCGDIYIQIIKKILLGIVKGFFQQLCVDFIQWLFKKIFRKYKGPFKLSSAGNYVSAILMAILNEFSLAGIIGAALSIVCLLIKYIPKIVSGRMTKTDWLALLIDVVGVVIKAILNNRLKQLKSMRRQVHQKMLAGGSNKNMLKNQSATLSTKIDYLGTTIKLILPIPSKLLSLITTILC